MLDTLLMAALLLVTAIGLVLIIALRRPDHFRTARTLAIRATPERLHGLIGDLHEMNTWNPYALRESGGTSRYSGPQSGPGARFEFDGPKSGTGSVSVLESRPEQIVMRLHMTKPLAVDNRVEFTLEPRGAETLVTWAMSGRQPLLMRAVNVVYDCTAMLHRDFDEGLANLKAIAERA